MSINSTTITRDGQITIPEEIRRELAIEAGDRFDVERIGDFIRIRKQPDSLVDRIYGIGRSYAVMPPLSPREERRWFEHAVGEEVWAELEQQRVEWEVENGRLSRTPAQGPT